MYDSIYKSTVFTEKIHPQIYFYFTEFSQTWISQLIINFRNEAGKWGLRVSYIVILAILDQNLFLILAIFITIRILSQYQNSKLALAATLIL